ncbi:recombinase family protein [Salipaludibacillus aurantiacus]|uniref:Resolvase, N terminal domain n=1 Tax=Salipaludibacillus aurantiacus TaxID=1601833 RepID=A0A1H9ULK3_9BACI|nr:recombinase family protein [Salipaludibacillus aurantiacus]SES10336.1 Resolvase, N terminal domain [Salipaludibacillus aurantiacus]
MADNNQNNKRMKRLAVASVRRSSQNQEGNNSFEIQKMAIKDLAESKGYYIPDVFIFEDDGVSAYKKKASRRSGLQKMKRKIIEEDIEAVFFYDFSRIDRMIYSFVSEFYYDVIAIKPHLKFFTTTSQNEWSPSDLDVKLQLIIANAESGAKSIRALDSQGKDLKSSKRPGSKAPFGFKLINKELSETEEAPIVLLIFHLAAWGHSVNKIANILNDANIPSPSGGCWRGNTVHNILNNKVYQGGHFSWNFKNRRRNNAKSNEIIKSNHQRIVPNVLYYLIDGNRKLKSIYNKLDTPFIFSGLLRCHSCGNLLQHRNFSTKKSKKQYDYMKYQCKSCSYEMDMETVNQTLVTQVENKLALSLKLNKEFVQEELIIYREKLNTKIKTLESQIRLIEANGEVACQKNNSLSSIFRNAKDHFNNQVHILQNSIHEISILLEPEEVQTFMKAFQDLKLNQFEKTEQRVLLLNFIKEITVIKEKDNKFTFDIVFKMNPVQTVTNIIG